jgi:hypothetical protein
MIDSEGCVVVLGCDVGLGSTLSFISNCVRGVGGGSGGAGGKTESSGSFTAGPDCVVGAVVGCVVGAVVGCVVGAVVGAVVGCVVGAGVGMGAAGVPPEAWAMAWPTSAPAKTAGEVARPAMPEATPAITANSGSPVRESATIPPIAPE